MCKTPFTQFAGVWRLSGVNSHVPDKASLLSETDSTLRAFVRIFTSVDTRVAFKGSFYIIVGR